MQKKLLASLLVTPLAFNALADIDINFEQGWVPDGLVGEGEDKFQVDGDMVTAGVAAGELTQTLSLPVGDYELSFASTDNLKVTIVGAQAQAPVNNVYKFTVATAGNVTITIEAETKNKVFSFSDAQVKLLFDFDEAQADLQTKLDDVFNGLQQVAADDESADAKALRELYAGYQKSYNEINALIATVKQGMTLQDFANLDLGKYPDGDKIDNDIKALNDKIVTDNYTVKLNAYNAYVANMAKYDVVAADLKALQDKMSTLNADKNAAIAGLPTDQVDFVNDHDNSELADEAMAAYAGAVSEYLAKINETYEDLLDEEVNFEPEDPDVATTAKTEVDAYDTELRDALADVKAFNDYNTEVENAKPYRDEQLTRVLNVPVVEGYEDLLYNVSADAQKEINDIYDALKLPANYNLENAAENLSKTLVDNAKNQMAQVATDFENSVKANNDVLENDINLINEAQEAIDAIPDGSGSLADSLKKQLQNELNSLEQAMKDAYSKLNLTESNPNATDITADIKAKAADVETIAGISQEFEDAKKYVDEQLAKINSEAPFDKFNDNFKNTFENIQNAINALDYDNLETEAITNAIQDAKDLADQILEEANNVDGQLEKVIDLNEAIADAIILGEDGDTQGAEGATITRAIFKSSSLYKSIENDYNKWLDERNEAAGLQNNDCYTLLKDVYTEMNKADADGNDFGARVTKAINTFKTNVELSNTIVINKVIDKIDTAIDYATTFNDQTSWEPAKSYYNGLLTTNEDSYKNQAENLKKLSNDVFAGNATEGVTILTVYNDLKALLDEVQKVTGDIQANQAAYNDQLLNTEATLDNVQGVIDYLNNKLQQGGNGNLNSEKVQDWQDRLNQLLVDLAKANREIIKNYGEGNSKNFTSTLETEYTNVINQKADEIRAEITNEFGDLVAAVNNVYLEKWAGQYANLRDLLRVSIESYNWYVKINIGYENFLEYIHEKIAESNEILYSYNALITELNKSVRKAIEDSTTAEVCLTDADYATITAKWQVYVNEINQTVLTMENNALDGVETYYSDTLQALKDKLQNYADEMAAAFIVDNEDFIDAQLEQYRNDLTNAQDAKALVETPEEFDGTVVDMTEAQWTAFQDYIQAIHDYVKAINDLASDYFQPVETLQEMTLVTNCWIHVYDRYEVSKNTTAALAKIYGYPTTEINDEGEEVTVQVPGWNADVKEFMAAGVTNTTAYSDYEYYVTLILSLNLDGTTNLEELKTLIQKLYEYEFEAEQNYKALQDEYNEITSDSANQAAVDKALKAEEESFEILQSLAFGNEDLDGLAGAAYPQFANIYSIVSAEIKLIRSEFASVTAWTVATRKQYETRIATLKSNIETAFRLLIVGENTVIGLTGHVDTVVFNLKVAFNNLVEIKYFQTDEELQAMNEKIDNIIDAFMLLNANYLSLVNDPDYDFNAEDADSYKEQAQGYEAQLVNLLTELQGYDKVENTYTEQATAALEKKYLEAEGTVNVALANLETKYPYVYKDYTAQVEALLTRLETFKKTWTASGNLVIAYQQYYINLMKQVLTELEVILNKAAIANQDAADKAAIQAANQARYEALTTDLTGLMNSCDQLAQTILSYNIDIYYQYRVNDLKNEITKLTTEIDTDYTTSGITESEKKQYDVQIELIRVKINNLAVTTANQYAKTSYEAASAAYNTVRATLNNYSINIVNRNELWEMLWSEYVKLDNLFQAWSAATNGGTVSNIAADQKFGDDANAVKLAINAILQQAKDNTYTLGDLNDAPDGVVNVADIQILLNWVGRGLTKEDLTPAQWAAADINGSNTLNISDVVALINMVFHNDADNSTIRRVMARNVIEGNSSIAPVLLEEEGDIRRYAVMLNNDVDFIGGQIDFNISAGAEIVGITAADRAMSHDVNVFDNGSYTRVLLTSLDNAVIDGNDGAIMIVEVKNGKLYVDNAVFADTNTAAHEISTSDTTFIDKIYESGKAMKEAIYNTAGQMMKKVQRGINIIRNSDGSVTKKMGK